MVWPPCLQLLLIKANCNEHIIFSFSLASRIRSGIFSVFSTIYIVPFGSHAHLFGRINPGDFHYDLIMDRMSGGKRNVLGCTQGSRDSRGMQKYCNLFACIHLQSSLTPPRCSITVLFCWPIWVQLVPLGFLVRELRTALGNLPKALTERNNKDSVPPRNSSSPW